MKLAHEHSGTPQRCCTRTAAQQAHLLGPDCDRGLQSFDFQWKPGLPRNPRRHHQGGGRALLPVGRADGDKEDKLAKRTGPIRLAL